MSATPETAFDDFLANHVQDEPNHPELHNKIEKALNQIKRVMLGLSVFTVVTTTPASPTNPTGNTGASIAATSFSGRAYSIPGYGYELADKTIGRVDRSKMTTVNITTAAQLRSVLRQSLTDTLLVLAAGDYYNTTDSNGIFEQNAPWQNVELTSLNGDARLVNPNFSAVLFFQGSALRKNIALTNFALTSTWVNQHSGTTDSVLWGNELPQIDGLELGKLDISCPKCQANALGWVRYSTSSGSNNQTSKNVWIHELNLHDTGRCAMELTCQGYDGVFRFTNLLVENCTMSRLGVSTDDGYGMGISISGLFKQVLLQNNTAKGFRRMAYELVNAQQVLALGNNASDGTDGCGWSISDDDRGFTQDIYISGGSISAPGRPFYCYQAKNVNIDGQNIQWKGYAGVDMNHVSGCTFSRLKILVRHDDVNTDFQLGDGTVNCTFQDMEVSSAGAQAEGKTPGNESIVLRNTSTGNKFIDVKTTLGMVNGDTLKHTSDTTSGGNGAILNLAGTSNTVINNVFAAAA